MYSFFEWLSELERNTQMLLFGLVVFSMVIIPYFSLIVRYTKFLIKPEPLHIAFFELRSTPHVHVGTDKEGAELYARIDGDGIFIDGCAATLIWQVTGARNIDILPVGKSLQGNSATVIIDTANPEYTLTATGFNGKTLKASIRIPENELYRLAVSPLGELSLMGNERSLKTQPLSRLWPANRPFSLDKPMIGARNSLINAAVTRLNPEPVALRNDSRRALHTALGERKILAVYNYSTTKYNQIRHFYNESELDYSTQQQTINKSI